MPVWKRKQEKKEEKSIGFHYLVGQCHWPVNDPVTAVVQGWHRPTLNRCWQEENMLTGTGNKLEHRFALQAAVRGGIVQGHHVARGELSWGGGVEKRGGIPSQPPSTVWLSSSPPQTLLSFHKLFTSGYTKGNSVALIVAEGKFIKTLGPRLHPLLGHRCKLMQTLPTVRYLLYVKHVHCIIYKTDPFFC